MTIDNEAFIDLEVALHARTNGDWVALWRTLSGDIAKLATSGRWDEAHKLVDELDLDDIVAGSRKFAETLAEASMFLGASRVVPLTASIYMNSPDDELIRSGVDQWAITLGHYAKEALRLQTHISLSELEQKFAEGMIIKGPTLESVGKQGTQFSRATASLMISRLSTAGFMAQAQASGVQEYVVSEVMDAATCPICNEMHGKRFPVSQGAARIGAIMQATDPDALKSIAPFPSQSAANIKNIAAQSQDGLIKLGMELPPYHPYCRGIATLETALGAPLAPGMNPSPVAPGNTLHLTSDLTPDELGTRMFGEFDSLNDDLLDGLLGFGVGAEFSTGDE